MANDVHPVVDRVLDVFSDPEYKFPYPRNRDGGGSGGVEAHAPGSVTPTELECPHCRGTGRIQAETMGQRIQALRLARRLTTNDVVRLTNNKISQGNLNHLEAGRHRNIRIEVLEAIASVLKTDAGYLLTGRGEP